MFNLIIKCYGQSVCYPNMTYKECINMLVSHNVKRDFIITPVTQPMALKRA